MNYELAKELKENGFPSNYGHNCPGCLCFSSEPTLSELIEACGEGFKNLIRINSTEFMVIGEDTNTTQMFFEEYGESAEEAVAKLWIALNKK